MQQLRSTPDILIIHFIEIHSFLASTRRGIVQQQIEDEIDFPVDHLALELCLLGPPPNINIHTYINININNTLDIKRLQSETRKMIASKIAMIHKLEMLQIFSMIARHTFCSIRRNRFVEI